MQSMSGIAGRQDTPFHLLPLRWGDDSEVMNRIPKELREEGASAAVS
jgi:hypothetical protein